MPLPIGEMGNVNPYRWQIMADTLHELRLIDQRLDVSPLIFDWQQIEDAEMERTVAFYRYATNGLLIVVAIGWSCTSYGRTGPWKRSFNSSSRWPTWSSGPMSAI